MKPDTFEMESFWPPFCPNPDCLQHAGPARDGFLRHGHYVTRLATRRVLRFRCRACRRTMSSQTFDVSYRLRRPELEEAILEQIGAGATLRKVAQLLGVNRKTVSRRLRRARERQAAVAVAEVPGAGVAGRSVGQVR